MNQTQASPQPTQADTFQRRGLWWCTMGFTRTHLLGVFITTNVIGFIGLGFATFGFLQPDDSTRYLLVAVCIFQLEGCLLLGSILSLLFYAGSRIDRAYRSPPIIAHASTQTSDDRAAS